MNHKTIDYQQLVWASRSSKSGRKGAGKTEGFHLPNSVTEDVGGWTLFSKSSTSPTYSAKQRRSIVRRQRANQERRMNAKW